jgi:hypothetical protein
MPYYFGRRSREALAKVHEDLVDILYDAIEISPYDFCILSGYRSEAEQNKLYASGRTEPGEIKTWLRGGRSRHNCDPSEAVDFAPYPIDWEDSWRFGFIGGLICACAKARGIEVQYLPSKGDFGHVQFKR